MNMKTLALSGILALTAAAASAQVVATGRDGGGYDARAEALVAQIRDGWTVENFAGSEDIARAVCADNEMPVGIAQIDAMLVMQNEGCTLTPLGIYPAQEYAFIMFPPGGENELDDLNADNNVLIGEIGSGAALFWHTIVAIEEGDHGNSSNWAEMTPVYGPFSLANTQASMGSIDAVIMVTSPDAAIIQQLLTDGWEIGELDDKDIDDFQFGRGSLYERSSIEVDHPTRWRNINQDAVEVRSYWIGNTDWLSANPSELSRMSGVIARIQ